MLSGFSHFPPFAPLQDPTQALLLRSAGCKDASGRILQQGGGGLRPPSDSTLSSSARTHNFSGFGCRTRARTPGCWGRSGGGARHGRAVGGGGGRTAREPGIYVGARAAPGRQGSGAERATRFLAGPATGRAGMAPPQSLPKLLLLAALAGFLGPSEVRRPAPGQASARVLKALCKKVRPGRVARGEGTRSPPHPNSGPGKGENWTFAEADAPALRLGSTGGG